MEPLCHVTGAIEEIFQTIHDSVTTGARNMQKKNVSSKLT